MLAHFIEQPESRSLRLVLLPVDEIRPNPYQPRRRFDETGLKELADSIRSAGLIQPLIVRKTARGYELIAGERRLRACRLAGFSEAPCIVRDTPNESDSALMALIENVQRKDLHYFEEAECCRALLKTCFMTQEQLAVRLGKSQSALANKLRLLRLSPCVRRAIVEAGLTERHARALLRLPEEHMQLELVRRAFEQSLTVKEVESLVEKALAVPQKRQKRIVLLRDYRLFLNAVKSAAAQLRLSGAAVEMEQTDTADGVELHVRVRGGTSASK